jgi:hypothetical protein
MFDGCLIGAFFTRAIAKNTEMLVARRTEILFQDNAPAAAALE